MQKELEPIQQLEARRDRLSSVLEEGNAVIGRRSDKALQMKEEVGTTFEATLKYGRYNKASDIVKKTVNGLTDRLNRVDQELEPHAVEFARKHIEEVNLRRSQLAEMSELVVEEHLTEDDLRRHQLQFEELVSLPQRSTLLQRGLERIKQEEGVEKREAEDDKGKDKKSLIEILPDGKVRLPNGQEVGGKMGELLSLLKDTSEDSQKDTGKLGKEMYPEDDDRTATSSARSCIARTKKGLIGTGVELVSIMPDNIRKAGGEKASHFLREEKPTQTVEQELSKEVGTTTVNGQTTVVESPKPVSLSKVDTFIQELPEETGFLLGEVRNSEDFRYAAEVVSKFVPQDDQTVEELRASVAGYLFETLAYSYLKKQFTNKNKVPLSPKDTFEIFYLLHSDREKVTNYRLQNGIQGISVPDGLMLTRLKNGSARVDGICEYSVANVDSNDDYIGRLRRVDGSRIQELRDVFELRRIQPEMISAYIRSIYRNFRGNVEVSKNPKLYIVLPQDIEIPSEDQNVEQVIVPVSRTTFGQFVSAFMSDAQEKYKSS